MLRDVTRTTVDAIRLYYGDEECPIDEDWTDGQVRAYLSLLPEDVQTFIDRYVDRVYWGF